MSARPRRAVNPRPQWSIATIIATSALLASAMPSPAGAQDTPAPAKAVVKGRKARTVPPPSPRGEVIAVTASGQTARIRRLPQSVSSYSSEQLQEMGIRDTKDLLGITPGISLATSSLSPTGESQQLVIRGVGNNAQLEPGTGTYVDEIYMPAISFDMGFLDPARVDIYKGPENVLFSRNSEAGAVSITTRAPGDRTVSRMEVGYGSYNTAKVQALISGRIARGVYGSLLAYYTRSDGYFKNTGSSPQYQNPYFPGEDLVALYGSHIRLRKYTGIEQNAGFRSEFRFVPSDRIEIRLIGDYHRDNGNQSAGGPLTSCHCYNIMGDLAYQADSADYGVGINAKWHLPFGTLTSVTSWREAYSDAPIDFVGNAAYKNNLQVLYEEQQSKVQTLRLDSLPTRRLTWGGGISAYKDREYSNRFYSLADLNDPDGGAPSLYSGFWNSQIVALRRTGIAGFVHAGYAITPHLHLDAGVRYTWEHVDASGLERYVMPVNGVLTAPRSSLQNGWQSFNSPVQDGHGWYNASPSASLRYDLPDLGSIYLSYAQGFKSGSYQKAPFLPTDVTSVAPEKATNYELGGKFRIANRVNLTVAGYDIEMKNQQVQSTVIRDGITSHAITNAAASRVTGFESGLDAQVTQRLNISGSISYIASRFLDYVIYPGAGLAPVVRSGDHLPSTPDWTADVMGSYTVPLAPEQSLAFQANFRWVDSSYVGSNATSSDPILNIPAWNRLDLRITYKRPGWRASFYINNALDRYIILSKFNAFFVQPSGAFVHNIVASPMMTGFELSHDF